MIFVTVGTQLPFPRLIDAMNAIAADTGEEVIAQAGMVRQHRWDNLHAHEHLAPEAFEQLFGAARLVVGHAGIGTILTARQLKRPLVVMPRRHALGEHRNDHQLATAHQLEGHRGIYVAWDTEALAPLVTSDLAGWDGGADAPEPSRARLIGKLADFIAADSTPRKR